MTLPALSRVAHADWSIAPRKRWIAVAERNGSGWRVEAPEPFGEVRARLDGLDRAGRFLLGVDCPLGVPRVWAGRAAIGSFPELIRSLRAGASPELLTPAASPAEIGIGRPFYPARPGGTAQRELLDGLGVASLGELRRRCDRPTATRRAACPMFWTMRAQQCGKGAIAAWRELLLPDPDRWALWPFDGPLATLLGGARPVLAETYPAESCRQLGLRLRSKRSPVDRAAQAGDLRAAAQALRAELSPALVRSIVGAELVPVVERQDRARHVQVLEERQHRHAGLVEIDVDEHNRRLGKGLAPAKFGEQRVREEPLVQADPVEIGLPAAQVAGDQLIVAAEVILLEDLGLALEPRLQQALGGIEAQAAEARPGVVARDLLGEPEAEAAEHPERVLAVLAEQVAALWLRGLLQGERLDDRDQRVGRERVERFPLAVVQKALGLAGEALERRDRLDDGLEFGFRGAFPPRSRSRPPSDVSARRGRRRQRSCSHPVPRHQAAGSNRSCWPTPWRRWRRRPAPWPWRIVACSMVSLGSTGAARRPGPKPRYPVATASPVGQATPVPPRPQ